MPIDASIPLQVQGPQPITLNSIAQLSQMVRQKRMDQQNQQAQNALLSIYRNPGSLDQSGMPTPDAIRQISAINPQMGMELRTNQAKLQSEQALTQKRSVETYKLKGDAILQATEPALLAHDQAIASGMSEQQAQEIGQREYNSRLDGLKNSGIFSDQEKAQMPAQFDPNKIRAGSIKYKDYLANQYKDQTEQRADKRLDQQMKHEDAMENIAESRLGMAEKRMDETANAGGGGDLSPDAIKAAAARYNVDGTLPPMGMGKAGASMRDKILNEAASLAKGVDPTQQRVDQLSSKASASARAGLEKTVNNIQLAEKTALGSAAQVEDLSKDYTRSSVPLFNKGLNSIRESITGDPKLAKLNTGINTLKNEYTKVMSGAGQSTDSARAEADHLININMSHEQLMASIGQMKAEMQKARENAIQQSRGLSDDATRRSGDAPGKTLTYDPATGTFK